MRTIIAVLLAIIIAGAVKAQDFTLTTSTAQGVIINRDLEGDMFTATIQVTPAFQFDKVVVSMVAVSYTTNEQTGFLSGGEVGYEVIPSVVVKARGLLGNTGKQLFGGGVEADLSRVVVFGNAGYETKDKETWLEIGVGYKIIDP